MPVTVSPALAASFVPSAKVRSWGIEPVFLKVTSYVPAAATVTALGLKPRSKASIEIVLDTATALAAGLALEVAPLGAGVGALGAALAGALAAGLAGAAEDVPPLAAGAWLAGR